mgnify:CR=1 FL=1
MRSRTKCAPEARASRGAGARSPRNCENRQAKANLNVWMLLKPLNFKIFIAQGLLQFMHVLYSFRECHYSKRTKIEIKLKS